MNPITRLLHRKVSTARARPNVTPLFQCSSFLADSDYFYTRKANPNTEELEAVLCDLEGCAHAVAVTTGMAAITMALRLLKPGDRLAANALIYGRSYRLFATSARTRHPPRRPRLHRSGSAARGVEAGHADGDLRDTHQPAPAHRPDRRGRARPARALAGRARRGGQHVGDPALPAAARARRRPVRLQRDQVLFRPQRRDGRRGHHRAHRAGRRDPAHPLLLRRHPRPALLVAAAAQPADLRPPDEGSRRVVRGPGGAPARAPGDPARVRPQDAGS